MQRFLILSLAGLMLGGAWSASTAAPKSKGDLDITTVKAPVAPDGTTAGAFTDFVIAFVDRDPAVDGIGLKAGGSIEVVLPDGFVNTGSGTNTVILLQGWPQSPRVPFPYTTNVSGNTITLTMTSDWPTGTFGPGPKQVHLVLFGFRNPSPGRYPVEITIEPEPGADLLTGEGSVDIIPKARPSVNIVSLFSGPPGPPPPFFNPIYQTVAQGSDARRVGLYLWAKDSASFVGVDLSMTNRNHGQLVDASGRTVGHAWIDAPRGAKDYELTTEGPSTEVTAFVTGVPVGLLLVKFSPDPDVTGDYVIRLRLNNGNEERLFVTVE